MHSSDQDTAAWGKVADTLADMAADTEVDMVSTLFSGHMVLAGTVVDMVAGTEAEDKAAVHTANNFSSADTKDMTSFAEDTANRTFSAVGMAEDKVAADKVNTYVSAVLGMVNT